MTQDRESRPNNRAYSALCKLASPLQMPASELVPPTDVVVISQRYTLPASMGCVLITPAQQSRGFTDLNLAVMSPSVRVVWSLLRDIDQQHRDSLKLGSAFSRFRRQQ